MSLNTRYDHLNRFHLRLHTLHEIFPPNLHAIKVAVSMKTYHRLIPNLAIPLPD